MSITCACRLANETTAPPTRSESEGRIGGAHRAPGTITKADFLAIIYSSANMLPFVCVPTSVCRMLCENSCGELIILRNFRSCGIMMVWGWGIASGRDETGTECSQGPPRLSSRSLRHGQPVGRGPDGAGGDGVVPAEPSRQGMQMCPCVQHRGLTM